MADAVDGALEEAAVANACALAWARPEFRDGELPAVQHTTILLRRCQLLGLKIKRDIGLF